MLSAGPHEGADDLDLIGEHLGGEAGAERKTRKFGNAETKELFDRFKIVGRNKRTLSAFGSRFRLWFAF